MIFRHAPCGNVTCRDASQRKPFSLASFDQVLTCSAKIAPGLAIDKRIKADQQQGRGEKGEGVLAFSLALSISKVTSKRASEENVLTSKQLDSQTILTTCRQQQLVVRRRPLFVRAALHIKKLRR